MASLRTIKDFDFGVGGDVSVTQRVSESPNDISKVEVDFIVWLMLEQEFLRSRQRRIIANKRRNSKRRTQCDGFDVDGVEGETNEIRRNNEKIQIAREYAEETLKNQGLNMLWQDLSNEHREDMIVQLCCQNCDFFRMPTVQSVPDIFRSLRSSKFRSKFNVKQPLARGGFGEVFLVTKEDDTDNKEYAVKKITPCDSYVEDVVAAINESKILKKLKGHSNIVEMHDYWLEIEPNNAENISVSSNDMDDEYDEGPLKFYIQLEFCGPSLETWKESNYKSGVVPEKSQILDIALQIFDGLAHIHGHGVLHLDINPKNIFWKNPACTELKIVDFGLAREVSSHNTKDGTVGYIAPESPLTHKSDVYSASVTVIEVAKTIYTKLELSETIQRRAIDTGVSTLDKLLSLSLEDDPFNRPSAAGFLEKLSAIKD